MSCRYITRSIKSKLTKDMINALEKINGKVIVKMRELLVVEFNFSDSSSIILFKLVKNKMKIIDPDAPSYRGYRKNNNFKTKYGDDRELLQKIENFLKMQF